MRLDNLLGKKRGKISSSKLEEKLVQRRLQFDGALSRLPNFATAIKETTDIEGAIVEAGVGSGLSLAILSLLKQVQCPSREVFAFDSFRSFPPEYVPGGVKTPDVGVSLLDHVKDGLAFAGVDSTEIRFVEGYFSDTVASYVGGPIAILHLDVDLGKSYTDVLNGFWEHLAIGGVIIFDEYDSPKDLEKWPDAKPAIDAFFEDKHFDVLDFPYLTRRLVKRLS